MTLQSTGTSPQWEEPTAFNGSEFRLREKLAATLQFKEVGHTGCWMGSKSSLGCVDDGR